MVANPPGAILNPLSFNALATQITKGATVTSIAVGTALAGNEFSTGDKVKLVNPITGQVQTFTVASAPSAGATSIAVNSATANFDIPVNAGMFVQLTPQAGGGGVADGDKGDITVSSSGTVWTIDNNVISNAKIRQSAGFSVIGRSGSTTSNVSDIVAGTDGHVLRRSGSVLGFGRLTSGAFDSNTIPLPALVNLTEGSILGSLNGGQVVQINKANAYSFLDISGTAFRVPYFSTTTTITTSSDLTYSSSGRLGAKQFINQGNLYSGTNVAFDTGAGTGPTTDSITGGGNWIAFTFTTGTSPAASATVATITLAQSFPNETCPIPSAGNANAAGQMTNFFTEATTTTITLKVTTALAASTQYIIRFNLFGR